jgi:hypothetical protein
MKSFRLLLLLGISSPLMAAPDFCSCRLWCNDNDTTPDTMAPRKISHPFVGDTCPGNVQEFIPVAQEQAQIVCQNVKSSFVPVRADCRPVSTDTGASYIPRGPAGVPGGPGVVGFQ